MSRSGLQLVEIDEGQQYLWMRCVSVVLAVTEFALVTRLSVAVVPLAVAPILGCDLPGFLPIV